MKAGFGWYLFLPQGICAALPAMKAEISFDNAANNHAPDSAILNRYFLPDCLMMTSRQVSLCRAI